MKCRCAGDLVVAHGLPDTAVKAGAALVKAGWLEAFSGGSSENTDCDRSMQESHELLL